MPTLKSYFAAGAAILVLPLLLYAAAVRSGSTALTAIAAIGFLFVVPGLLGTLAFRRLPRTRATAHVWSLAANTAALMLLGLLLRRSVGIRRETLAAAWLAWTACLFLAAWRRGESLKTLAEGGRRYGAAMAVGLVAILAGIAILFPEQFTQCFNEDGTETYELARSLRDHFLPYWELETWDPIPGGRMGTVVVNPSLVNSYWTCALATLLGDGEAATRLPYWIWWAGIFLVSFRQIRQTGGAWWCSVPLALLMFLVAVLFTFYVGYNPYMADIANPGVPDALFTLCLLLSFDCLREKDRWGWAIAMLLASLVLYAGPVLLVLTLATAWWWKPIDRRETLRFGRLALGLLAAAAAFYAAWGWWDGSLRYWLDTLDIEYVQHYLADVPRWTSGPLFFGYFVLGSGGVAVLGLLQRTHHAPRDGVHHGDNPDTLLSGCRRHERVPNVPLVAARPGQTSCPGHPATVLVSTSRALVGRLAWRRTVATVVVLYLLVVLGSGFKNLHWLAPLWPIPLVLFLSAGAHRRGWRTVAAICSLLVCLWICWPKARSTFTLNRALGERTTIATQSDLTAATWARVRYVMHDEKIQSWDCDQWTWVVYAGRDLRQPRPLLLTDGGPPSPDYRLLASQPVEGTVVVARLYCRDPASADWLAAQRPPEPLERYPWVFQPLARGLYSPHENTLQDVRRLRWPGSR